MGTHSADRSIYLRSTFWRGVLERAVKTAAQSLLAYLTVGSAITDLDWVQALAVSATATLFSVVTSLADPESADVAQTLGAGSQ